MFELDGYGKYKVKYKCKYNYISDKIGDDYVFSTDNVGYTRILHSFELIDKICHLLKDDYFSDIHIESNVIKINHFNYNNGENSEYTFELERVDKELLENE